MGYLRYTVTVCGHVNATFLQRGHAEAHFEQCAADMVDLSNRDIKLLDGTEVLREAGSDEIPHFCCPQCGCKDMRECVEWEATSLDPTDRGNTGKLIEYQCTACSRSVWVGASSRAPKGWDVVPT